MRSASNDAPRPARIAQKAEVIPATAKGVAATAKATSAPNLSFSPKAFSSAPCSDDKMASPARVTTKVRGSTPTREATEEAASATVTVRDAAIRLAQ